VSEPTPADLARRVDELETQAAFQEELHRRLDETVARQDREILELKAQLRALARRLQELGEADPGIASPSDEVPPHY
jgi:SlyX protein